MFAGKTVVFGVTGCIAAYKAVDVVSRLRKLGADVFVIMTKNATRLVNPLTFRTISDNPVTVEMFEEPKQWNVEHIALAERADLFMVCPATANIIGKVASGIADDFLSTTIMATRAPTVFVPAMNNNMYENPITQRNIAYLKSLGYHLMEPDYGRLASGKYGKGRFPEPCRIVEFAAGVLDSSALLSGKRVLVTAGPTREIADPVWFVSNWSSGKMGYALAQQAARMGAQVVLVSGPSDLEPPQGVEVAKVVSTEQMMREVMSRFCDMDIVVMAAAPVDYRPAEVSGHKLKKGGETYTLRLVKNPDILALAGKSKSKQVLVGFAGETEDFVNRARQKLVAKNADMIVANDISKAFGKDDNQATIVLADGTEEPLPNMPKSELARHILARAAELCSGRTQ